jgi:hypothetical protein
MSNAITQSTAMKQYAASAADATAQSDAMTRMAMETNDSLAASSFQAEVNKKINSIMEQSVGS